MANSIVNAFKKIIGTKKEERKNIRKISKKKTKSKERKKKSDRKNKPGKNIEKDKKKKLKELRLSNLKKAREKRMKKIERKRKKEERLNKLRLKNLKKAREERSKQLSEEKRLNKLRLKSLEKARKRRKEIKQIEMRGLVEQKFVSYEKSVKNLLDKAGFKEVIRKERKIILKPNLTKCKAFPTTTDAEFVEAVIKYIRKCNKKAKIIIAEGSGRSSTEKCYKKLGYLKLDKYDVELVDLNNAETIKKRSKRFKKFRSIEFPKILLDGFLISLPVLKGHGETKVTISLKNMIGCYPACYYQESGHNWKNILHKIGINNSIHDILSIRPPDYAICDASIAQLEHEINGYPKEIGLLLAGNPLEVDKRGALLLGYDWKRIPHLVLAMELLEKQR